MTGRPARRADVRLELRTPRLLVTLLTPGDAARCRAYYVENDAHFRPWDPPHPPGVFDERLWSLGLQGNIDEFEADRSLRLWIIEGADARGTIVGTANFTNIARGPFQSCVLGYSLDHRYVGRGYMTEALEGAIAYVFVTMKMHRITAAYRPENERSAAVLRRLGFTIEGMARHYLYVDGAWRDHVLASLTNPVAIAPL